MFNPSM
jgi:V-type H+-transporting ATPase subunit a